MLTPRIPRRLDELPDLAGTWLLASVGVLSVLVCWLAKPQDIQHSDLPRVLHHQVVREAFAVRAELPAQQAFRDIRVQWFPVPRSEFKGGSQLTPGLLSLSGQRVELCLGVLVDGELVHPATGRLWRA